MDNKEILVTGAAGYIGKNFIEKYSNKYFLYTASLSSNDRPDLSKINTILHLSALVHQTKALPDNNYFNINTKQTVDLASGSYSFYFLQHY